MSIRLFTRSLDPSTRLALLLAGFFLLFYFVSMPGYIQVLDSELSLRTAQALVDKGSLIIEPTPGKLGIFESNGRSFSKYGPGLAFCWVPFVLLAKGASAISGAPYELVAHFLVSSCSIFFGAAACAIFHLLLRHLAVSNGSAALGTLGLGMGTMVWKYSVYDFSEIIQMCALLIAFYGFVRNETRWLALSSVALSLAVFVKLVTVIYLPLFVVYLWVRNRADVPRFFRKLATIAVVGAPFALLLALLNYLRFGSALESGYGGEASWFSNEYLLDNLWNLTCSLEKGLLWYSPILLFSIAAFPSFWRQHRHEARLATALVVVNLVFHARYAAWEGGWCWGPRYQVAVTFLLMLPAAFALDRHPRWKWAFVGLLILSTAVQCVGVAVKDQEYLTIRQVILGDRRDQLPSALLGEAILLQHKLTQGNNRYSSRELGLEEDFVVDTSSYSTFLGLNIWHQHLSRQLQHRGFLVVPWLVAPILVWLLFVIVRQARRADQTRAPA